MIGIHVEFVFSFIQLFGVCFLLSEILHLQKIKEILNS